MRGSSRLTLFCAKWVCVQYMAPLQCRVFSVRGHLLCQTGLRHDSVREEEAVWKMAAFLTEKQLAHEVYDTLQVIWVKYIELVLLSTSWYVLLYFHASICASLCYKFRLILIKLPFNSVNRRSSCHKKLNPVFKMFKLV